MDKRGGDDGVWLRLRLPGAVVPAVVLEVGAARAVVGGPNSVTLVGQLGLLSLLPFGEVLGARAPVTCTDKAKATGRSPG